MRKLLRQLPPCRLATVAGGAWLLLAALPATADIYAYSDAAGVMHYSNVPVESAYELVLESPPEPTAGGGEASLKVPLALINRRAAAYEHIIREAAVANELEPEFLRAVISVESAFNPRAVSRAGARGLMQLMPQTAKRFGVRDSFDPRQNIHGGARYLRVLVDRFANNLELVVAAYNAGENAVERYGRSIPPYRETRQYVPRVLNLYHAFSEPLGTN
jgi:soluble lytic murein transglycosylase-like protein